MGYSGVWAVERQPIGVYDVYKASHHKRQEQLGPLGRAED